MKLNRNSWLVRWAYWMDAFDVPTTGWFELRWHRIPERTSLCSLFWRITFIAPVMALMFLIFCVALVAGTPVILAVNVATSKGVKNSIAYQGAKAIKNRVCPIVELVDE